MNADCTCIIYDDTGEWYERGIPYENDIYEKAWIAWIYKDVLSNQRADAIDKIHNDAERNSNVRQLGQNGPN